MVYVISKNGKPLMPTGDYRKVRLLLRGKKATVVRTEPFTIRLLTTTHNYTQPVTLGIDAGSRHVGFSAATEKAELFAGEMDPRNDVVKLLATRREFRKTRRGRATRHRPARFDNRVRSKRKGWLAPSVEVKINNHLQLIRLGRKLLPVTRIRIETAEFDLQRLKAMESGHPLPVGADYQLGEQYDSYNVRQYVLHRDGYACQQCGARPSDKKAVKLHVHHLESRQTGGNAPDNLITLCEHCHKAYHAGDVQLKARGRGRKTTRDAAFMGIMRKTLIERVREEFPDAEVQETHGYVTKYWRERMGIEKTHINDAFVIARNFGAKRAAEGFLLVPKRRHNRQIHKAKILKGGKRKANQSPKWVHGFQLFDKVRVGKETAFIFGRRSKGGFDVRKLDGTRISANISPSSLRLVERRQSVLVEKFQLAASSPRLKAGGYPPRITDIRFEKWFR